MPPSYNNNNNKPTHIQYPSSFQMCFLPYFPLNTRRGKFIPCLKLLVSSYMIPFNISIGTYWEDVYRPEAHPGKVRNLILLIQSLLTFLLVHFLPPCPATSSIAPLKGCRQATCPVTVRNSSLITRPPHPPPRHLCSYIDSFFN